MSRRVKLDRGPIERLQRVPEWKKHSPFFPVGNGILLCKDNNSGRRFAALVLGSHTIPHAAIRREAGVTLREACFAPSLLKEKKMKLQHPTTTRTAGEK